VSLDMRGRWYRSNKRHTVDRYQRLDVAAFADLWRDSEAVGLSFPVTWPRGGRISVEVLPGGLRLDYAVNGEPVRPYIVSVTWTDQRLGKRAWWLCPGCGRRCRYLYGGRLFLCRTCHGLTYVSSQKSKKERLSVKTAARMWAIRRRLGARGSLWDPLPGKPRGMHWRTYYRLVGEYEELLALDIAAFYRTFGYPLPGGQTVDALLADYQRAKKDPDRLYFLGLLHSFKHDIEWEDEPEQLTLGELASRAGVPYAFAKEAAAAGLVRPDWGRGTRRKRYRPGLVHWLRKLHRIRAAGQTWEEVRAWTKRRWLPGHEHERAWPEGVKGEEDGSKEQQESTSG